MTQEFVFDTDDLGSFEKMLQVIGEILFGGRKFGDSSKLHIQVKDEHYGFPDGRNHRAAFAEQPEVLAEGGKYFLLKPHRIFGGASFRTKGKSFTDKDEAAKASCSKYKEPKPSRKWIATINDWGGDLDRAEEGSVILCPDVSDMVRAAMELMRAADKKDFLKEFGDGYHYGFNSFDGSIGVGYRMEWSPSGAQDLLHLSMVHAYYGK